MISLLSFKAKMAALGAALLSFVFLFLRLKSVKRQRDSARVGADTIKVRHETAKERIQIEKDRAAKQVSRSRELAIELEKPKEERDMSQFTRPNDY